VDHETNRRTRPARIALRAAGGDAVGKRDRAGTGAGTGASTGTHTDTDTGTDTGTGAGRVAAADSTHLIGNAKREGDTSYHVYTLKIDGTEIRRINDRGEDACSYYFPDGKHLIWTSTKDHPELAKSNYSDPTSYPRGAELYTSDLEGHHVKRLTKNTVYDAEVSVSPAGKWILFGSQLRGKWSCGRPTPTAVIRPS
jgi:hypothetical protein